MVGIGQPDPYGVRVNTGGRRRPLGPRVRGLSCCALVIAVLSLWLGAGPGVSSGDDHGTPSLSHSVAVAQVALRPPAPDVHALPTELVALSVVLATVLVVARGEARRVTVRSEPRPGRAPPGGRRYV